MYPREYIVKFLQEPNRKTGQQPDIVVVVSHLHTKTFMTNKSRFSHR